MAHNLFLVWDYFLSHTGFFKEERPVLLGYLPFQGATRLQMLQLPERSLDKGGCSNEEPGLCRG